MEQKLQCAWASLAPGTMGSGIVRIGVLAGFSVVLHDLDEARVARGRQAVARALERLVSKGFCCY